MSLREKIVFSGFWLLARGGIGVVLSIAGTLALTSILGPAGYGIYATALGLVMAVMAFGDWGFTRTIMRRRSEITPEVRASAWTANLCVSIAAAVVLAVASPLIERAASLPGLACLLWLMAPGIVLGLGANFFGADLNRQLRFREQGTVGVAAQAAYFVIGIALASAGAGAAGPALAWPLHHIVAMVWCERLGEGRPLPRFRLAEVRSVGSDGLWMRAPVWSDAAVYFLRQTLLARLLGASILGHLLLAERLVETANLGRRASGTMVFPIFSRIDGEPDRTGRALKTALVLQALFCGGVLLVLVVLAPPVLPALLGEEWRVPAVVLALCACAGLLSSQTGLLAGFLNVQRAHKALFVRSAVQGAASLVVVWVLCSVFGVVGAAAAGLMSVVGVLWLASLAGECLGRPGLPFANVPVLGLMIPALFVHQIGWLACLPLLAILTLADVRKAMQSVWRTVMTRRAADRGASSSGDYS